MLLFIEPTPPNGDGWLERTIDVPGGRVRTAVAEAGHSVAIELDDAELNGTELSDAESDESGLDLAAATADGGVVGGEAVGELDLIGGGAGSPVSTFHVPRHYRWEAERLTFRFDSSWREAGPSVAVSLRHLRSLRSHPRALSVDDDGRTMLDLDGAPVSAIVMGAPTEAQHPDTAELAHSVDWRGWHVLQVDDPFAGLSLRVLTTHSQAWWT